jgi:hypothetical protein
VFESRHEQSSSLLRGVQIASGAHPAAYQVGPVGSYPGVKRPGNEAEKSPPSNAEVKNGGATPALPCLIN